MKRVSIPKPPPTIRAVLVEFQKTYPKDYETFCSQCPLGDLLLHPKLDELDKEPETWNAFICGFDQRKKYKSEKCKNVFDINFANSIGIGIFSCMVDSVMNPQPELQLPTLSLKDLIIAIQNRSKEGAT